MRNEIKIIILILMIGILSCQKEPVKYPVTFTVIGNGNYVYQIGSNKTIGHCIGIKTIDVNAQKGDYVLISAKADSTKNGICVELKRDVSDVKKCGTGSQLMDYQF